MKRVLLTLLSSALIFSGCTLKKDVVIKVNNKDITKAQFESVYQQTAKSSQLAQMGIDIPEDENNLMYLMLKNRVINELIVKELIRQEMEKRNITVSKSDTVAERRKMIDKIGSKEKFNEILKQSGITNDQFEEDLAQEIKMKKLVDIIHPVKISDNQAKAFYAANQSKFRYPDRVRASHILIAANPKEIKDKLRGKNSSAITDAELDKKVQAEMIIRYNKANEIARQLKNNPDSFEAVARDKSDDPLTSKKGGDIGFFAQRDMVKPFADAAFKLPPNTISDVIQTPYGFHIIKVTDRKASGQEPYETVKEQLKLFMAAQEQVKVLEQFINNLRANAVVQYKDDSYNPVKIEARIKKISEEKKLGMQKVKPIPPEK